jgi:predicted DNA-binding transcriptional regulator AlpA
MSAKQNPVIASILANYPAQLSFLKAAEILGYSDDNAYTLRRRIQFPVRIRLVGKRLVCFTSDIAQYLDDGESQASQSVPQIARSFKVRTGRPGKRESLTALKLGVSVKELRAMPINAVKTAVGVQS